MLILIVKFSFGFNDEFIHFTKENNKLTNNIVEAVVRDNYGYIWVGTNNGLNRLDGYSTKNYMHNSLDSSSISSNFIKSLLIDNEGDLWIGTIDGGLNLFNRENNTFIRFPSANSSKNKFSGRNISSIIQDQNGLIWIGTIGDGIYSYSKASKEFVHYQLNPYDKHNTNIRTLFCDSNNNIWIGFDYESNGIYRIDGISRKISFYSPEKQQGATTALGPTRGIIELNDGRIITCTWTGRFYQTIANTNTLKLFKDETFLNNASISYMINDEQGNIFIGCWEQGLYRLNDKFEIVNHYQKDQTQISSIQSNAINSLYIDSKNKLYVAYRNNGISLLNLNKQMFKQLNLGKSTKTTTENIDAQSFAKDKSGNIWIASRGNGLIKYNKIDQSFKQYTTENCKGLKTNFLLCTHIDSEGMIWVGTDGKFIAKFNPETEEFKHIDFDWTDWSAVFAIAETDKYIWCGTWGSGLKKVDKKTHKVSTIDFDTSDQYRNSIFDLQLTDSLLWIANIGIGLYCLNLETDSLTLKFSTTEKPEIFPNARINDLSIENENILWISTSGGGAVCYNVKTNKYDVINQEKGLSSDIVQSVLIDNNKKHWFFTQTGITVSDSIFHNPIKFYTHNGLLSNQINKSSAFYDSDDNTMYAGTQFGINYFDPTHLLIDTNVNQVVFTGLSVMGEEVPFTNNEFYEKNIETSPSIHVKSKQKLFTVYFSSMDFSPSFLNCYYYQLEGFDKNWIYTPYTKNFAQYTNLNPGTYYLKVKTRNRDGIESKNISSLKIVVKPAFYQTLFFNIASILLLVFSIAFAYRVRYRSLHKAKILLEKNVKERTAEIERQKQQIEQQNILLEESNASKDRFFSIIGHDLNNPMSSINQLLEYLEAEYKNMPPEKLEKFIINLRKSSTHTIELLNNLLSWARTQTNRIEINQKHYPICELFENVNKSCLVLAEKKNQKITFDCKPEHIACFDFNTISTVLRNLLTNAIKYSDPDQEIRVVSQKSNNEMIISVIDKGIGIKEESLKNLFKIENFKSKPGTHGEKGTGFGLVLCYEFVILNNGRIWAESTPGKGSTFSFSLNFEQS
ncbi:MAG: hypothetical protein JW735_01425 [Prolixibacteraceae bacterium]|nr:hypothetical protein [Prolixibacteraceae bacterium]